MNATYRDSGMSQLGGSKTGFVRYDTYWISPLLRAFSQRLAARAGPLAVLRQASTAPPESNAVTPLLTPS